jgi:hypothetical protein
VLAPEWALEALKDIDPNVNIGFEVETQEYAIHRLRFIDHTAGKPGVLVGIWARGTTSQCPLFS